MFENLNHYLQPWGLSNAKPLSQTATSYVYTVDYQGETVVLKILTPIGIADEKAGTIALRCYDGQGAVKLLRHDDGAQLLEYVDGIDLVPMVHAGEDEDATRIIVDTLNKIHSASIGKAPTGLQTLRRRFRSLFSQAKQDKQAGTNSIFVRAATVTKNLLDNPLDNVVLHGDMHHMNILRHRDRGWVVIDPKGIYGERTYDAANVLCNPGDMPELVMSEDRILRISKILADGMGIEQGRVLAFVFAYACLSAKWSMESGDDWWRLALRVAELTEPHLPEF